MFRFVDKSNQCYLNSCIQVLTPVPSLPAFLARTIACPCSPECVSCILRRIVVKDPWYTGGVLDVVILFSRVVRRKLLGDIDKFDAQECAIWGDDLLEHHGEEGAAGRFIEMGV